MPKHPAKEAPPLPVIDLFAGPGGLGEGFSAFRVDGDQQFDLRLSIEKDAVACATLRLRSFFRQFEQAPPELLAYFAGEMKRSKAFASHPAEAAIARSAVWNAELGKVSRRAVTRKVRDRLAGAPDWVLLGGPPCQAYSIAGRARMSTRPDFEQDERHFLYREYLRIVADHEPSVFVLENVKGLITSKHAGQKIVKKIVEDLRYPANAVGTARRDPRGYRLYELSQRQHSLPWEEDLPPEGEEFLVRAEEFGVPQMRHRIFIVGVRTDIPGRPGSLQRAREISAGDVLSDLPVLRSRLTREDDSLEHWRDAVCSIRNCKWMSSKDPRLVPVSRAIEQLLLKLSKVDLGAGSEYTKHRRVPAALGTWYRHDAFGLTHHESRSHMRSDLHRYIFAAAFAQVHGRSPELQYFPAELRPAHRNVADLLEGSDMFNDRFRVQLKNRPATTITSHISKDGHYYIHYDPIQCRSLTVREAARLQTFPDSYYFEGNRTQQYHQIGNAVPPLLAIQIAQSIYDLLVAADRAGSDADPAARGRHPGAKRTDVRSVPTA